MRTLAVAISLAFTAFSSLTAAQFVTPYPVSDCSGGIAFGQASCPNQEGCCAGGAACCAGGCCPIDAWCVNQGMANEGCCPLSDSDSCGASIASFAPPACTAPWSPKPSVQCVSADDDWYCPPGSVCNLAINGGCFNFPEASCTSDETSPTTTPPPELQSSTDASESIPTTGPSSSTDTETTSAPVPKSTGLGTIVYQQPLGMLAGIMVMIGLI